MASLFLLTHVLGGAAQACRCPPGEGRARRCALGFCPLPASGLWGYISFFQGSWPRAHSGNASPHAEGQGSAGGPSAWCRWGCPSCTDGTAVPRVPCPSERCGGSAGTGEDEPGGSGCPRPHQPGAVSASCPSGPRARRQCLQEEVGGVRHPS